MRITCLFVCSMLLHVSVANAQGATLQSLKRASAARVAENAIRVDGRLDEPSWEHTPAIVDFVQKEPTEGAAPSERMAIRFVYDASALYVGARMYKNPDSPIQAPLGRRDRLEQAEHILIALDTFLDRRTA